MGVIKRETDRKTEVSTALTEQYNRTLYSVFSGSTMHKHETKRGVLFSPFIQFSHKFNSIANTGDVFDDFCTHQQWHFGSQCQITLFSEALFFEQVELNFQPQCEAKPEYSAAGRLWTAVGPIFMA